MKHVSLFVVLAVALTTSPVFADEPQGTLRKIITERMIRLGYQKDLAPFSSIGADGKPRGYTVELCHRVVAGIRNQYNLAALDIEWIEVTMTDRFQLVADGAIDLECGVSAMTLSRLKLVDFSAMTWIDSGTFLVKRGIRLNTNADLAGKKIAVFKGSTTDKALREVLLTQAVAGGPITTEIVQVKGRQEGMEALEAGTVDAIAGDRTILGSFAASASDPDRFALAEYQFMYEPYGLPLRRNDADFKFAVNSVLASLYHSGEVMKIYKRWFGNLPTPPLLES
ncbi:MAG TPA: amino acid ABC transporter substrate-binding protein, partial [Burkholderiales bacterium]